MRIATRPHVQVLTRTGARAPIRFSVAQALWWLSIAAIVAGIAFRFSDLGAKTFWGDEAYTLLRVSGYAQHDLDRVIDGSPHGIASVRFFQRVHPEQSIRDTANSLAVDEPQHPPLYFVAERLWMGVFGDSVIAARSLSALAGVIALLGMFWLARELFPTSQSAPWIAVALVAVSPFHVAYSHEAREYSMWAAATFISTATLLRAIRRPGHGWWVLYALAVAAGCYTDLIFAYVVAAHGIALLCLRSTRTLRIFGSFCVSAAAGIVAFTPWLLAFYQHRAVLANDMGWAANAMPLTVYLGKIAFNVSAIFFDLTFLDTRYGVIGALVLCTAAAALLVTARWAPPLVKAIIFALLVTASAPFIVEDALHHTYFATGSRYFVPVWIGLELAVTYACAAYADRTALPGMWRSAWRWTFVALIVLGSLSNAVALRQSIWWDNHDDASSGPMANVINASPSPLLLIKPDNLPRLLVLSRYLRDDARFEIVAPGLKTPRIANIASVYVLSPDAFMRRVLARTDGCRLRPVALDMRATPADDLHASLSRYRGSTVDALWQPVGGACR